MTEEQAQTHSGFNVKGTDHLQVGTRTFDVKKAVTIIRLRKDRDFGPFDRARANVILAAWLYRVWMRVSKEKGIAMVPDLSTLSISQGVDAQGGDHLSLRYDVMYDVPCEVVCSVVTTMRNDAQQMSDMLYHNAAIEERMMAEQAEDEPERPVLLN
jgi:hypothetical protein